MECAMLVSMPSMPSFLRQEPLRLALALALLVISGCRSQSRGQTQKPTPPPSAARGAVSSEAAVQSAPSSPVQVSPAFAARLKEIAEAGQISGMERPNFSDYKKHFVAVYEVSGYAPLWLRSDGLSTQGSGIIQAVEASDQ